MNILKSFSLALCLSTAFAIPSFAGVTVSSPGNGSQVSSPFTLSANAPNCSSQSISAMGYSLDDSSNTTIVNNNYISANVGSGTGWHTLHVKAWGQYGAVCVTDISINVTSTASGPSIPGNAASVGSIQAMDNWIAVKDSATGTGWVSAWTGIVGSPSMGGTTRQFSTSFGSNGGARYSVNFGDDENAQNFVYDGWVYLTSTSNQIANLEMDMNQVMPNGQTVIFGFQCDGYTSTWDYTYNAGSATHPNDQWAHTNQYCNPRTWSTNAWHHVQVLYSRDGSGNVTYKTVWLDGNAQQVWKTAYSAFALGWAPSLLTNFQVDGLGAGGAPIVFLGNLTVYRW